MNRIARLTGLAALILMTSSGLSYAQPTDAKAPEIADGELPSGWDVLDREVEAMGGAERYLEVKNFVAIGGFSMPAMGIEGEIVRTEAAPNSLHMSIELGGMGSMVQACDGEVAWMIQPGQQSANILEGEMAEEMLLRSNFYDKVQPHERYKDAQVLGVEDVNGKACYKLTLTPEKGTDTVAFFELETGYRVKTMSRSSAQAEVFDAVIELSDFREVNGIVHPFVLHQKVGGNEFTITFETIEHDAEIDTTIFSPPAPEIPEGEI